MGKTEEIAGDFYMLDWTREVDSHEAYIEALEFVINFYQSNSNFRLDVIKSTAKVLGKGTTSSDESESGKRNTTYLFIYLFIYLFVYLFISLFIGSQ